MEGNAMNEKIQRGGYLPGETVAILWTGGWDSTYRVIELSQKPINIQPVYILDSGRGSNQREQAAIRTITELLQNRSETRAEFLPIDVIKVEDIKEDEAITEAWKKLHDEFEYGIQHDWIARLAAWKYPMIELCIEKVVGEHRPTSYSVEKYGAAKRTARGTVIDREKSQDILNLVLGNVTLPIFDVTERQMLENVKAWGYMDVMEHIWFCHMPIDGKPCGLCSPCHTKMDSGMEWLLPERAQQRFRRKQTIIKVLGRKAGAVYSHLCR